MAAVPLVSRELKGSLTRAVATVSAARKPAGEVWFIAEVAGAWWCTSGSRRRSTSSSAWAWGPAGAADWDQLSAVEAEFQHRRTPLQAEVCTLADGALLQGLTRRGYQLVAFKTSLGGRCPSPT